MSEWMSFDGIETNNLKNISIKLKKNSINLIIGPSGSGKSSLAYDTVSQIGLHEYLSLFDDRIGSPSYRIKEYSNILPTVPIQQKNNNNNLQSTIGSYFGMNSLVIAMFCLKNGDHPESYSLQRAENVCPNCYGIGFVKAIDINKIVDGRKKVKDIPFKCWYRYSDFYKKILAKYCDEEGIDQETLFSNLSKKDKEKLLYGESKNKYCIQYKHGNGKSSRTTKYYGVMLNMPMIRPEYKLPDSYYSRIICPKCSGKKYSELVEKKKLEGESIGSLLIAPFEQVQRFLEIQLRNKNTKEYCATVELISNFVKKCLELNLGHLSFNRAIPTLSGGELQRLRLVRIFSSKLNNMLIVLDEPLAGLSAMEKKSVFNNLINLSEKHTLLVVDHSDSLIDKADNIIALGPRSGINGGQIIGAKQYLEEENKWKNTKKRVVSNFQKIEIVADIYEYNGVGIQYIEDGMNILSGKSGVGKSTVLREYLPMFFESYEYINQKYSSANQNSNVATLLGVAEPIFKVFANEFNKSTSFFSNNSSKLGACKCCTGAGSIVENGITLKCDKCRGTGFDISLDKYKINGKSLLDIWNFTLEDAVGYFKGIDEKLASDISVSKKLLLEHLILGQQTSTLSGGENIRTKLFRLNHSTAKVIGIDEPFRGLGKYEIAEICSYLTELTRRKKTIFVVDHETIAFDYFDSHMELKNNKGKLIGIKGE